MGCVLDVVRGVLALGGSLGRAHSHVIRFNWGSTFLLWLVENETLVFNQWEFCFPSLLKVVIPFTPKMFWTCTCRKGTIHSYRASNLSSKLFCKNENKVYNSFQNTRLKWRFKAHSCQDLTGAAKRACFGLCLIGNYAFFFHSSFSPNYWLIFHTFYPCFASWRVYALHFYRGQPNF